MVQHLTAQEIIQYISDAKKTTPLKVYVNGRFDDVTFLNHLKSLVQQILKLSFVKRMIGNRSMNKSNSH